MVVAEPPQELPFAGHEVAPELAGGWRHALRLLVASRVGLFGVAVIVFFVLMAVFGPALAPQDPTQASSFDPHALLQPPSTAHWLGTDELGRDVLSEVVRGARISLVVGFAAAFVSAVIGVIVGVAAGYFGGWTDRSLTMLDDWFLVIPWLPLAIVLTALLGPKANDLPFGQSLVLIFVIGVTGWAGTSRIIRAQVLSLKERQFVERARAMGASHAHVMWRHILPNVFPLAFANTVLIVSIAILSEVTLSYLGLGDPQSFDWGTMLNSAYENGAVTAGQWGYFVAPGLCITLVVLAVSMVGHALEEILDPRLRKRAQ